MGDFNTDKPLQLGYEHGSYVSRSIFNINQKGQSMTAPISRIFWLFILWTAPAALTAEMSEALREQREHLDRTVWAKERLAQEHERSFVKLWDDLRQASDSYEVLGGFVFERLKIPRAEDHVRQWDMQVKETTYQGELQVYTHQKFGKMLEVYRNEGYEIEQTEWHHSKFSPSHEKGAFSEVSATLHVKNTQEGNRYIVTCDLMVIWSNKRNSLDHPLANEITVKNLKVISRKGAPLYHLHSKLSPVSPDGKGHSVQPVILYDLNRDGLNEIVLTACNLLLWNRGQGQFQRAYLMPPGPYPQLRGRLIADLTGDGLPDYLGFELNGALRLVPGRKDGQFDFGNGRQCWTGGTISDPGNGIQIFAAGDVDRDGDLDIWLAQYKLPYERGQMPTPYYDANDGYPSYLLLNDGNGTFTDGTVQAGLQTKRYRRTYSSSLVDLDDDDDLDLWVVNDFAGVDLYLNDGTGHFEDQTTELLGQRHNFGMAHEFGDFDGDGQVDIYVTGMASTTARRLDYMGVGRRDFPEHTKMRTIMGYGNRMYLKKQGRFVEPPFRDRVNRTGWSWGATAFDLDNDGDLEIYIANGHVSGNSAQDYCSTFWCHDIYTGNSQNNPALDQLFATEFVGALQQGGLSWNGFEHNHLLLNDQGRDFLNAAFLFDIAFEFDARGVISEDFDNNGFMDLLVVQYKNAPLEGETLYILQNTHSTQSNKNNWIGVRLQEEGDGISPLGAKVTIDTGERKFQKQITNGRFYGVQHANQLHFGLGDIEKIDAIEVRWTSGQTKRIIDPKINQYHLIQARDTIIP